MTNNIKKTNTRVKSTIILVSILIVAFAAGITAIILLQKSKRLDMSVPYNADELVFSDTVEGNIQTARGFAADLCVSKEDVGNSEITMEGNAIGALFSVDDKEILFSDSLHDHIYPASITKIMTAILALKYGNMEDVVTITWEDLELEAGSQVCGFEIGDQVSMDDLFHGLLIHSGNDAAMAIARHVGGTAEEFVVMMNEEANALGCFDTHFMNPSGLHNESHYTSIYDIYLMLNHALTYSHFVDVMQLSVYEINYLDAEGNEQSVTLDSTDHYLVNTAVPPKGVTVLGGKTGTTDQAGSCLALVSQNAYGKLHISIIMRALGKDSLYNQMNTLLAVSNSAYNY